jgi:hypothetical protein
MMPTFHPGQSTGIEKGREIANADMMYQQRYTAPTQFAPPQITPPARAQLPVGQYNLQTPAPPVKYSVPTYEDQYLQNRAAVRAAAAEQTGVAVQRTDPITDAEVAALQKKKEQAETADFDQYVNSMINPRKPGELQWLMSVYPEFVQRRIEQVQQDYEFAMRNQMIDTWGINTKDDLMFKYLVDQKRIDGPRLGRHKKLDDGYAPGLFSPFNWRLTGDNRDAKLYLPYASARDGVQGNDAWNLGAGQVASGGRGTQSMARGFFGRNAAGNGNITTREAPRGYQRATPQ